MKPVQKVIAKLDNKFGEKSWYNSFKSDYLFRTLVIAGIGTAITVAFSVYNAIFAALNGSLWYYAFAGYLFVIAVQRVSVFVCYHCASKHQNNLEHSKLKIYLGIGIVFLPVTVALSVIIALLLNFQKPVLSNDILAIATAVYAFFKMTMAIVNFFKARHHKDIIAQTLRNIGLVDAVVSIVMLESTLTTTFGEMNSDLFLLLGTTGLAACAFALALGIYMVVFAAKQLKASPCPEQDCNVE